MDLKYFEKTCARLGAKAAPGVQHVAVMTGDERHCLVVYPMRKDESGAKYIKDLSQSELTNRIVHEKEELEYKRRYG